MKDLRERHRMTDIPPELDFRVRRAIREGALHLKKQRRTKNMMKTLGAIAAAALVFVLAINGSPVFADYISGLPGGESVVRLLTFVGDRAIGGEITDGQDIRRITVQRRADHEIVQIDFSAGFDFTQINPGENPAGTAGHFTITRNTHPNSIVVHVSGVRGFTAAQNLPNLGRMQLVSGIYRIVTFDDSAQRFVVTFNQPVSLEVVEQSNPARVTIEVRQDGAAAILSDMYAIRTASLSFGAAGEAEETFRYLGSTGARILRDTEGLYVAEEGLYSTRAEAESRLAELRAAAVGLDLHIEQRGEGQLPTSIR